MLTEVCCRRTGMQHIPYGTIRVLIRHDFSSKIDKISVISMLERQLNLTILIRQFFIHSDIEMKRPSGGRSSAYMVLNIYGKVARKRPFQQPAVCYDLIDKSMKIDEMTASSRLCLLIHNKSIESLQSCKVGEGIPTRMDLWRQDDCVFFASCLPSSCCHRSGVLLAFSGCRAAERGSPLMSVDR